VQSAVDSALKRIQSETSEALADIHAATSLSLQKIQNQTVVKDSNNEQVQVSAVTDKYRHHSTIASDPTTHTRHVVFIMTGAVRTLAKTHESILKHLVVPLCPPSSCTSHLVAHLSYSDNRPDTGSGDPSGKAIFVNTTEIQRLQSIVKQWLCSATKESSSDSNAGPPHSFHFCHFVSPSYNIGTLEERNAMDVVEAEMEIESNNITTNHSFNSTMIVNRIRSLRYADPRRYSMWFSRYWTWKYIQDNLDSSFSEFMFFRPDLLWYLPFMDHNFVRNNPYPNSGNNITSRDIWVHDSYYSAAPDTFAYLPNADVAKDYFSIHALVQKGVACLGGPDFNTTLAKQRLMDKHIFVPTRDHRDTEQSSWVVPWCSETYDGWSEQILLRKLHNSKLQPRWMPTGANLFRPFGPDCQPIQPSFLVGWAKHHASPLPILVCRMLHDIGTSQKESHDIWNIIQAVQPFRIQKMNDPSTCLTLLPNHGTEDQPCSLHPLNMRQVFSSYSDTLHLFSLLDERSKIELNISWETVSPKWKKEYLSLYTNNTLRKRE
jgi:hypothetical protein